MNKSVTAFTTTLLLVTSTAVIEGVASPALTVGEGVQIQNGKLHIGDLPIVDISLVQTKFSYLFIYVPGHGLITVSNREFPGAREAGRFQARRLEFTAAGLDVRLDSATPILSRTEAPAWVSVDESYSLDVDSVMVGYGDDREAPRAWERYVGSGR